MLGALCARPPKPWILTSLFSFVHHHPPRVVAAERPPINLLLLTGGAGGGFQSSRPRRHHSSACSLAVASPGGAASIWHAIQPSAAGGAQSQRELLRHHFCTKKGEGSWNVSCDARPARWLHRPDSAWLLFGVCSCLYFNFPEEDGLVFNSDALISAAAAVAVADDVDDQKIEATTATTTTTTTSTDDVAIADNSPEYRVTGVRADGRCLFRAIAHLACLRNGEEAPDEDQQTKLADELRARVVDELLQRRKEIEMFIVEDFDGYVNNMRRPYVWGGEPELQMASHVLRTLISVFSWEKSSGKLENVANYGLEYKKENEMPIKVLFHGYGHYDILETI